MIINNIQKLLNSLSQREIIKSAQVLFSSFFLRLIFQSLYFVILARTFGPDKYGSFIAIIAIISIFIPFSNWGSSRVLIQNVSRDQSLFGEYYGATILKTLVFGSAFISVVLFITTLYPIPNTSTYSVFLLALSNFIFMTLGDNCKDAFISMGLLNYTSKVILLLSANRFFGSLILITLVKQPTLMTWSLIYCVATLVTSIIASIMVIKKIGYPQFKFSRTFHQLSQGFSFSISDSAENIYNDLDKAMLSRLATVESVAVYGAAYHILNVSLLPMQSLMLATFRDFFQAGATGIQDSLAFCKKILPLSLAYSMLAIALIFVFSPLIPKILGSGYVDSTIALMWLSPTILFKSLHRLAADTLTGANYQKLRSLTQVLAAVFNGAINIWLIPLYQWRGAIWATLASEFLLMILLWSFVYVYYHKNQEKARSISFR
jgi:O-antigen/teichoic acid export membrane protein